MNNGQSQLKLYQTGRKNPLVYNGLTNNFTFTEHHQEEGSSLSNRPLVETAHRVETVPSRDREHMDHNVTRTPRAAVNHGHRQEPCVELEQKARMKQSPWTTDDSPPMDLDFDEAIPQRGII